MKKFFINIFLITLSTSLLTAKSKAKEFSNITNIELVKKMKTGWNLGNTLDANASGGLESETSWNQPLTEKKMIEGIAEAGFKTIRIPVSWSNHIVGKNHKIDKAWLKRVKEIVDWAIEEDLYVIINIHHDNYDSPSGISYGQGFYPNMVSWNESMLFVKNIWKQICKTFNDEYDEHLIFEILNEPRLKNHEHEWWLSENCNDCKYAILTLNKLNQLALNTIRESSGNNAKRFVMFTGLAASAHSMIDFESFKIPEDSAENALILSVHMYTPYAFAMENPGDVKLKESHIKEVNATFEQLNEKFISKGIPVVIGEYGATNKNNTEERIKWFTNFISESKKYGMCCCLWDNGDWNAENTYLEKFGFYNRKEKTFFFPEIIKAIMDCFE